MTGRSKQDVVLRTQKNQIKSRKIRSTTYMVAKWYTLIFDIFWLALECKML
jgi:hypothetical protein